MTKYKIAYQYLMCGEIEIEANSLQEAKDLAGEKSVNNIENEFCVDGTFEINDEFTAELNG